MSDISQFEKEMWNTGKLRDWLATQPREVSVVIATRAALRVVPVFAHLNDFKTFILSHHSLIGLLPCFQALALSWTTAIYRLEGTDFAIKANDAAVFAGRTARSNTTYVALAAFAAEAAARAAARADHPTEAAAYAANAADAASFATNVASAANAADAAWINKSTTEDARFERARLLVSRPLWSETEPHEIRQLWNALKRALPENENWNVWTRWYEDRRDGKPANEELELFRAFQNSEFWKQEPAVINKAIWDKEQEILARQKTASDELSGPPEIPAQLPGVHVEIDSDTGKIVFAPPSSLDAEGNNIAKLQSFQPQIKRLAEEALSNISANEQPELRGALARYFELINKPLAEINFDLVYAEGLFLEEAALAADRKVAQGLREPLSDAGLAALNSLNRLHPLFVLSSKAGRENLELANEYEATKEDLASEREAEKELAAAFSEANDIVAEQTADAYEHLANSDDSSLHAERTTSARAAFTNNMVVTVATGSAIATLGTVTFSAIGGPATAALLLPIYEGWKKSKAFVHVSGFVTEKIDELSEKDLLNEAQRLSHIPFHRYKDFMLEHEATLRKWAGTRKSSAWVHKHLDWLKSVFKSGPKN